MTFCSSSVSNAWAKRISSLSFRLLALLTIVVAHGRKDDLEPELQPNVLHQSRRSMMRREDQEEFHQDTPLTHDKHFDQTGQYHIIEVNGTSDQPLPPESPSGRNLQTVREDLKMQRRRHKLFEYRAPVASIHHKISTINEDQWPRNFCIDMTMQAPKAGHLGADKSNAYDRCIMLLGSHAKGDEYYCDLFNIYINHNNQVGMGLTCIGDDESTSTTGTGPLLAPDMMDYRLVERQIYNLSFCYNGDNGVASISSDKADFVKGRKQWDFPRKGQVSIFTGSHAPHEGFAIRAMNPEDDAKLYVAWMFEGTTTTTPPPHHLGDAYRKKDDTIEEVNVNAMTVESSTDDGETTTSTITNTHTTTSTTTKMVANWDIQNHFDVIGNDTKVEDIVTETKVETVTDSVHTDVKTHEIQLNYPETTTLPPAAKVPVIEIVGKMPVSHR